MKRFAIVFVFTIIALLLTPITAHAAYTNCYTQTRLTFGYIGNTNDGYTGVSQTAGFYLSTSNACDAPYEGHNDACATFRLVLLYSPSTGYTNLNGPWVRSCYSPQKLASILGGWVHHGDYVTIQERAEADGSHNDPGYLWN